MLVVDANILIASILKNSQVRKLITESTEILLAPEIIFKEIENHKEELLNKSALSNAEFEEILSILSKYLVIVKTDKIQLYTEKAEKIISHIDKDDVPIVATSLAYNSCPIWTDDKGFKKQNQIRIITTKELIEMD